MLLVLEGELCFGDTISAAFCSSLKHRYFLPFHWLFVRYTVNLPLLDSSCKLSEISEQRRHACQRRGDKPRNAQRP